MDLLQRKDLTQEESPEPILDQPGVVDQVPRKRLRCSCGLLSKSLWMKHPWTFPVLGVDGDCFQLRVFRTKLDLELMGRIFLLLGEIALVRVDDVDHCSVTNIVRCVDHPRLVRAFVETVVDESSSEVLEIERLLLVALQPSENLIVGPPRRPEPVVQNLPLLFGWE